MKNFSLSLAILGLCSFSQAVLANDNLPDVHKENYHYNNKHQCYAQSYRKENGSNELYCMKEENTFSRTVRVNGIERLYYTTTGTGASSGTGEGINGFFIYELQGGRYKKIFSAHHEISGNYYANEGALDWRVREFAPNVWGFYTISSGWAGGGGFSNFHTIVIPQQNKLLINNLYQAISNEYGTACLENKNECVGLETELVIDRSKVINGFYPLNLIVYGQDKSKFYNHQTFQSIYIPNQGYAKPSNYPYNRFD